MSGPPTQPILVRDGTVVPTAVGVSDPSLTLVEFNTGIGFILGSGFQADAPGPRWLLEAAQVWRCETGGWAGGDFPELLIFDGTDAKFWTRLARQTRITVRRWRPAIFFLTKEEFVGAGRSISNGKPGAVLALAIERARGVPALRDDVTRLLSCWDAVLSRLKDGPRRVQPMKTTIRISLPPKPSAAKETIRLELPPSPAVLKLPEPGKKTGPSASKLSALKQWLREKFGKQRRPSQAAGVDAVKKQLSKLSPGERAELERRLRKHLPPEGPSPQS